MKDILGLFENHDRNRFKDIQFDIYKSVSGTPEGQVIRYSRSRDSSPLWYNSQNQFNPKLVPKCPRCGARRIFEFQINC